MSLFPARAVERNRLYYDALTPGKDDYADRMAAPRHRRETFLRLIEERSPASVVDLGCGNGQLLRAVGARLSGVRLAGIDLSAARIEANRRSQPDIHWHAADLDGPVSLPPELRDRFDVVVASEIVEHLDRPGDFLATARALAAPARGWLLLSTQSGTVRETERRVGHRRHYDATAMRELLAAAGWTPVDVWNCGFPFHDLSKVVANLAPGVALRGFTEAEYGPLQKLACLGLRLAYRFNSRRRGAQLFAVARRAPGA